MRHSVIYCPNCWKLLIMFLHLSWISLSLICASAHFFSQLMGQQRERLVFFYKVECPALPSLSRLYLLLCEGEGLEAELFVLHHCQFMCLRYMRIHVFFSAGSPLIYFPTNSHLETERGSYKKVPDCMLSNCAFVLYFLPMTIFRTDGLKTDCFCTSLIAVC